ncbi:MAG: hypothetical protein OEO77_10215 [Acidimicrobiia bacterium]|nr:hypothetical protein [Acidimicrobiia bacterium]
MNPATQHAVAQLRRMRAMNGKYHERFFGDVRFALALVIALFVIGWWGINEAFLLVPFVALWGACQTAFDASYLIFSRQYAARLEGWLNSEGGADGVLVAAELEATYLFPLDTGKIVTVPISGQFSWFSFMTLFITLSGVVATGAGLWLGAPVLEAGSALGRLAYWLAYGGLAGSALVAGGWWFVGGVGERRLAAVLDARFGA